MKKIILIILIIIVCYTLSIFAFPIKSDFIWEKIWLTNFNQEVRKIRDDFNDFITNFDLIWKYKNTKNQAVDIKNNIENQIQDTKNKIEEVQKQVDETQKAIEDTTNSINNSVDKLNNLKNSVWDIITPIDNSNSWNINK